jgi:hypothetical protein
MKLHQTITALSLALAAFGVATAANAAALVGETYSYLYVFPASQQSLVNEVITPVTPAGKVFVIQTVSVFRSGGMGPLQSFIVVNSLGANSKANIALPDIPANTSDFYPAVTMALTAYVGAGTQAFMNFYRTNSSQPETDYVSVSGYLNAD